MQTSAAGNLREENTELQKFNYQKVLINLSDRQFLNEDSQDLAFWLQMWAINRAPHQILYTVVEKSSEE